MYVRNRPRDSQSMFGAGLFCLATGIVAQRFIHPPTDFWQGFVAGLSAVVICVSIVLNVRGLVLRRKQGS